MRHVASKDSFVLLPAQLTSELHAGQDLPLVFLLREIVASGPPCQSVTQTLAHIAES